MEWDNEKCIELIEIYASKREIWDRNHKLYHNKIRKHDAWMDIASRMECTVEVTKGKMNSLLSSFRRERNKESNSVRSGKGIYNIFS